MDDEAKDHRITFVMPPGQHKFTESMETVDGDPLLPCQGDDSTSTTSADCTGGVYI